MYAALDEEFSRPIFAEFTRQTGVAVRAKFDVESTKSVQLAQAIDAESERPRCDVFWNNEIVNTLRLQRDGLLAPYDSPQGKLRAAQFRDSADQWYGLAARVRVLVVNTRLVAPAERPNSILDLIDDKWRGRVAIAKPLAGTTATHAACLFVAWGPERAQAFFRQVKQNCRVLAGNRHVARAVAQGQCAFGLTDTDDALAELEAGMPVAIVFPDQTPRDGAPLGALVIPNTLAIIHGAPHRREAEQLVEFLLSPQVEESLAQGPSAQLPLHSRAKASSRVAPNWRPPTDSPSDQQQESAAESTSPDKPLVAMSVDFAAAAQAWDAAAKFLREEFATAE